MPRRGGWIAPSILEVPHTSALIVICIFRETRRVGGAFSRPSKRSLPSLIVIFHTRKVKNVQWPRTKFQQIQIYRVVLVAAESLTIFLTF